MSDTKKSGKPGKKDESKAAPAADAKEVEGKGQKKEAKGKGKKK